MKIDEEIGRIELCGAFDAIDRAGRLRKVRQVFIESNGYIPDVHVSLVAPEAMQAQLYDDEVFIGIVMDKLRQAGFAGKPFGRAELGMQSNGQVVLEPGSEFTEFAQARGFVLLYSSDTAHG